VRQQGGERRRAVSVQGRGFYLLAATKLDMEMLSRRVIVGGTKIVEDQQHALQLRLE